MTLPQGIQEPLMVRDRDGRPQKTCFCMRSCGALLEDFLWVIISMKCDLSVLSIYLGIFLCVLIVYHLLAGFVFI